MPKSGSPYSTGWAFCGIDLGHHAVGVALDLVHQLHRLDDAEHLPFARRPHVGGEIGLGDRRSVTTCRGGRRSGRGGFRGAGGRRRTAPATPVPTIGDLEHLQAMA
jgi:hypothetical protein